MLYKIISIRDLDGIEKTDSDSIERLGRVIDINQSLLREGRSGFFYCVDPGRKKSLFTSIVRKINISTNTINVYTMNSCYELRYIKKGEMHE